MRIVVFVIIAILFVFLLLAAIFVRRETISRAGGTIEMNMRLSTFVPERGWAPGLGRFVGDELRWYRLFSLSPWPRRVLSRQELVVGVRRTPEGAERLAMPKGWVVVICKDGGPDPVELALAETALTGFLSWIESAPPGVTRRN
jgi:hypothetical protein